MANLHVYTHISAYGSRVEFKSNNLVHPMSLSHNNIITSDDIIDDDYEGEIYGGCRTESDRIREAYSMCTMD